MYGGQKVVRAVSAMAVVWMMVGVAAVNASGIPQSRSTVLALNNAGDGHDPDLGAVQELLGPRQAQRLSFLGDWPAAGLHRLQVWLRHGIRFDGPWNSAELATVLDVLDAFGAAYGEARFAEIAHHAVASASFGLLGSLHIVRIAGRRMPAAAWYRRPGHIEFNDGIFDDSFVNAYYYWEFLTGDYAAIGPGVTTRHVVIGHELGHVLVDGLGAEARRAGYGGRPLEALYEQTLDSAQWPHQQSSVNENLATELAMWALGVSRTPEVIELRAALRKLIAPDGPSPASAPLVAAPGLRLRGVRLPDWPARDRDALAGHRSRWSLISAAGWAV